MSRIVRVAVKDNCYRVIPTKYPTINVFEDVADPKDFDVLYQIQAITNPQLEEGITSSKSHYIDTPFFYLNPTGSRFTDGTFGIYYAGCSEEVGIAETIYHAEQFMKETSEPAQSLDRRMIVAHLDARLHTISGRQKQFPEYYRDTDYRHSQAFGLSLYDQGSEGIRYSSVRHSRHDHAYAVMTPDVLSRARQSKHLVYEWNGSSISNYYEKRLLSCPYQ